VAPAPDGTVWYTGQNIGVLGRLDPVSGNVEEIPLGSGSAPHGVIVGPDGAAWVTDAGLSAIVRVDPVTSEVVVFPVGALRLNTAVFDQDGILWYTGQSGVFGRLDPANPASELFDAPGGRGPYGITVTPNNEVFYASLAGNHIARVDRDALGVAEVVVPPAAEVIEPPTRDQGARRVWSDSKGVVWVSEFAAGKVGAYDPSTDTWREWVLPGNAPQAYAVYVDETDRVWLTDFSSAGAVVRFDPGTEGFESFPLPSPGGNVRQLLGRPGEVWGAESASDALIVIRYGG
jgi:virginiamycin B lyase